MLAAWLASACVTDTFPMDPEPGDEAADLADELDAEADADAEAYVEPPENADWLAPASDHGLDTAATAGPPVATLAPSCDPDDLTFTTWPLTGANGRAWMVNNYVDLNMASGSLLDYLGFTGALARTYDGHRGIDIDISSFREMDAGTALVRAAAPGVVEKIREDQFDRNTSCTGSYNYVRLRHANGYDSLYLHLKKNSVVVDEDDSVVAGQILGVAGSSGCSSQPHLHFEAQDCNDVALESMPSMWSAAAAPVYQGPSDTMDVMLRKGAFSSIGQIKDPVPNPTLFKPGATIGIGLSAAARGGDVFSLSIANPSGLVVDSWTWNVGGVARYAHLYPFWSRTVGSTPGTWTLRVRVNGTLRATRTFKVSSYDPGMAEIAKHGVSNAAYQGVFNDIVAAGYRPVWVDGYDVGGSIYFNALFRPAGGVGWFARHNLDAAQYQAEFDDLPAGYRPIQVESYQSGSAVFYAAIFTNQAGPLWVAYHGKSEAQHQALFNFYTSPQQGYREINAAVASVGGVRYVTALYDKANVGGWTANHAIPLASYQAVYDAEKNAGRHLKYLDAYVHGGQVYLSGIWTSVAWPATIAQHGLSFLGYQSAWSANTGAGYLTRFVTGYPTGAAHTFAALWAK